MARRTTLGDDPLPSVILALTTVSGMMDAISFLGLGKVFIGMMTGNVVVLGFALGGVPGFSEPGPLVAILGFVAGIVLAGRGERRTSRSEPRRWFPRALLFETAFLYAATTLAWLAPQNPPIHDIITGTLATAMGVRCATVRRLAVPDLVVTFALTGALIALIQDANRTKWRGRQAVRRLCVILALTLGAAAGAVLMQHTGLRWSLLAVAILVTAITAVVRWHPALTSGARAGEHQTVTGAPFVDPVARSRSAKADLRAGIRRRAPSAHRERPGLRGPGPV
ncbi:hypothetical protein SSP35_18_00040 [Streptomyces sp. NBRC 110611]|uniref:YoaK family protein n=1 Tax=Streptomyces sp. NBRC 110611 TaxID=1621259 RepID=UPI0008305F7D|nr:YoaK family protein [Streptomyces sp. NBRC 110611]GAU70276.1 hypothetical protein SSP35_18_00040 [Streptomyces sp. NBRC 110611]